MEKSLEKVVQAYGLGKWSQNKFANFVGDRSHKRCENLFQVQWLLLFLYFAWVTNSLKFVFQQRGEHSRLACI